MRKILPKIIITFTIVAVVAISLKVSDNILANANASTIQNSSYCGVNNGYIWNGRECVNTCDQNHPWDPYNSRCSGIIYSTNNPVYQNTNCSVYGAGYYFNGTNCVSNINRPNANYYGNPYNGGVQNPVYGNINYQVLSNISTNNSQNYYNNYSNNNTNNTNGNIVYYNTYPNTYTNTYSNTYNNTDICLYSCYSSSAGPKKTEYYIYTITTTTSWPKGTPIYLGGNSNIYSPNNNYYSSNYNYSNSNYTSSSYFGNYFGNNNYDIYYY